MITVRHRGATAELDNDQLVLWLAGFRTCVPYRSAQFGIGEDIDVCILADEGELSGERYVINLDDERTELPAGWIIPWTSGLAARRGVNLPAILATNDHERSRRMQALMFCHQRGWLVYIGITGVERKDQS